MPIEGVLGVHDNVVFEANTARSHGGAVTPHSTLCTPFCCGALPHGVRGLI